LHLERHPIYQYSISKNGFSHVTFFYPLGGERKGKDDLKCGDWIN
jgi:hypothetical protein